MTQTEEHLTGDGIQVQDDISITIRPAAAWMRNFAYFLVWLVVFF